MAYPYTGIILAGGLSTRLSGRNKAFIEINGKKIIDNTYGIFKALFQEIILVTNTPELYREWDFKIVSDIYQVRSSMTGLHAGLYHASFPFAFAVACDSPFLEPRLIEAVLSHITPETYVVVPQMPKGYEPLCAAYSKKCVKDLEDCLENETYRIVEIFDRGPTIRIPGSRLKSFDPGLRSFFNINTPGDLEKANDEQDALCPQ
ncbi:MAG: molybdenum cofactor guanylyltransferase [Desulfobacter sp.]|nr:MAG: molybdenum cofactor guanylyltransferase [Desulfobacter sp.]